MTPLQSEHPSALTGALKLLYIEDDTEALQELAQYLKKRVASIALATNGKEALVLCNRHNFDAIICDLWMPEMDGLTFIKELRQQGIQTPVIITSAFSDSDTILQAVDLGIMKYCVKPVESEALMSCLSRIASDNLARQGDLSCVGPRIFDRETRLACEKAIKSGYAHLIKSISGKGPKEVHISLGAFTIELWATEVLTPLEQSLLQISGSAALVPFIRKNLYEGRKKEFESLLYEALQIESEMTDIQIDPSRNTDHLFFKIVASH